MKRCTDLSTGEHYVVKIIRTNDTEVLKSVKNEFKILKQLSHPNIVQVKEMYYNPFKSYLFMVQKEIEGINLANYIEEHGKCSEEYGKKIFRQILGAIEYIHKQGICHRDIKPENLMIIPETLEAVITDFNVSKNFTKYKVMRTHTGTVAFSAPETLFCEEYT